jgi:undecaprenyl-diphosphatase
MDIALLTFFNQIATHPFLDLTMLGLTISAPGLLAGFGVTMLLFEKERRIGLAVLTSLGIGVFLTLAFQFLVLRPRPEDVRLLWPMPNFPSYPSGHAAGAFAVVITAGLTYRRWRWWGVALIGATLVAFSRVYLGHHYPSDVLGGGVLGAAVGAACYGLIVRPEIVSNTGEETEQPRWRWLLWPQIAIALIVTQVAYLDILPLYLLRWPLADKTLHFFLFGMVVFWLNIWFDGRAVQFGRRFLPLAVLIPFTYALLEEGAQFFSPLRSADPLDLLSDLAGMLVFWWLSQRVRNKRMVQ